MGGKKPCMTNRTLTLGFEPLQPRFARLLLLWTFSVVVHLAGLVYLNMNGHLSRAGLLFGVMWEVVLAYGVPMKVCYDIEYRMRCDFLPGVQAGAIPHSVEPLSFI